MTTTDEQLVRRYRNRWVQIDKLIEAIRECPFCGNAPSAHGDGCVLRPVERCGKRIKDPIMGGTYQCRQRAGHKGPCDDW
jgi:hypothetical protein